MKHATTQTLAQLESLLQKIRKLPGLQERKPGIFYRRSQAFLHFHEDPASIFADLKIDGSWSRLPANSARDYLRLIRAIEKETRNKQIKA